MTYPRPTTRPDWGWQADAACRGEDLTLFFAADGERQDERQLREREAQEVCAGCPVRTECLDYSISRPERTGVWGGLAEQERMAERNRRMRQRARARAA